jgi:hypothetical protein
VIARKALRQLSGFERLKGAFIYLAFAATFVGRSSVRVDWQFASGTYRIMRSAEADLDGIDSATDFYCDNDSNGTFFSIDQVTGLRRPRRGSKPGRVS